MLGAFCCRSSSCRSPPGPFIAAAARAALLADGTEASAGSCRRRTSGRCSACRSPAGAVAPPAARVVGAAVASAAAPGPPAGDAVAAVAPPAAPPENQPRCLLELDRWAGGCSMVGGETMSDPPSTRRRFAGFVFSEMAPIRKWTSSSSPRLSFKKFRRVHFVPWQSQRMRIGSCQYSYEPHTSQCHRLSVDNTLPEDRRDKKEIPMTARQLRRGVHEECRSSH